MLQLLVRYGQLQIAAIYGVRDGSLVMTPLASIGQFRPVTESDPLLSHALEERTLVSIQSEYRLRQKELDTELLAAIPLIDSEDNLIGLCLVEAMPFFNFEPRSLRFLAILAGHMADLIHEQAVTQSEEDPEWRTLKRHLRRVGQDASDHGLPGALVGLRLPPGSEGRLVIDQIRKTRRGLDVIAERQTAMGYQLLILMPLTDELGLAGYLERMDEELRQTRGRSMRSLDIRPRTLQIRNARGAEEWLEGFLSRVEGGDRGQ